MLIFYKFRTHAALLLGAGMAEFPDIIAGPHASQRPATSPDEESLHVRIN